MATFNKIPDFVEGLAEGEHNLASNQLVVALSNTAPGSEGSPPTSSGNGILANVTQIAYTNLSSRNITTNSSDESGGTYALSLNDLTLSASGGAVAGFRYIYIYNDTSTTPDDQLIGYYDYGSTLVLNDGESLTIDFGANGAGAGNLFTLA